MQTCPKCGGVGQVRDPSVTDPTLCDQCFGVGQIREPAQGVKGKATEPRPDPLQLVGLPRTDLVMKVASAIASESDPVWGLMKAALVLAGEIDRNRGSMIYGIDQIKEDVAKLVEQTDGRTEELADRVLELSCSIDCMKRDR